MASKPTNFEVQKRVDKVFDMLMNGLPRARILQFASEKGWDVTDRTVDSYIRAARKLFAQAALTQKQEQIGIAISRLNNLYEKCMMIQDYKAALAVQKEMNTLLGLHEPAKQAIKIDDWRTRLLEDIQNGTIRLSDVIREFGSAQDLMSAINEPSLATRLFAAAGLQLQNSED